MASSIYFNPRQLFMKRSTLLVPVVMALALVSSLTAYAQTPATKAPAVAANTLPLSDGEVRKVDKDAKKITIRHGEIKNLDMPPMTMVFQVADPALLEAVKTGDKVKFVAEKIGSAYVVTRLQAP